MNWLFAALYLYAVLLCIKGSIEGKGALRSIALIAALFVLPSAAYLHLAGGWDLTPSGVLSAPSSMWVIRVKNASGETQSLNIILGIFSLSLIFILATLAVTLFTSIYDRRGSHAHGVYKPFVKWGMVFIGTFLYLGINGIGFSTLFLGMGAASLVVGFALQETIANLFTGVALDVEGVVRHGNWIEPEGGPAGRVMEKGWRSTRIRTLKDETVVLPNKLLAGGKLTAFGGFDHPHARMLRVGAAYGEAPLKVKEILRQVMLAEPRVLPTPAPTVQVAGFGESAIEYRMLFWISDFGEHLEIEDALLTRVWYAFKSDSVEIPFPMRNLVLKNLEESRKEEDERSKEIDDLAQFLGRIEPLKTHLGRTELEFLARNASIRSYHPNEGLLRRGDVGDSVYFVESGFCKVKLPTGGTKKLGAGEFFGEMALFKSGSRTADVVAGPQGAVLARIGREPILAVFRSHPGLETAFALTHEIRSEESGLSLEEPAPPGLSPLAYALTALRRWLLPW